MIFLKYKEKRLRMAYINMLYFSYHRDSKVKEQNERENVKGFQNLEERRIVEREETLHRENKGKKKKK